jgi:hypothetical protein
MLRTITAIVGLVVIAYEIRALMQERSTVPGQANRGSDRRTRIAALGRWSLVIAVASAPMAFLSLLVRAPEPVMWFFVGTSMGGGVLYVLLSGVRGILDGLGDLEKGRE